MLAPWGSVLTVRGTGVFEGWPRTAPFQGHRRGRFASSAPCCFTLRFDNAARAAHRGATITDAVFDGSIYPDIARVHPLLGSGATVDPDIDRAANDRTLSRRAANRAAVQEHCKRDLRAIRPLEEGRCGPGVRR